MGALMSYVARKANRFNIENRTYRFLEKDKRAAAPKFESNIEDMKRALEMDPQLVEKLSRKDTALDDRLKSVYVTSEDRFIDYAAQRRTDPDRPLPLDRKTPEDFEYGYREPKRITLGHCTLRQAMKFITDHQADAEQWTAKRIADDYKIKEKTVEQILFYFRSFNLYIPDKRMKEKVLTQSKRKFLNSKQSAEESST